MFKRFIKNLTNNIINKKKQNLASWSVLVKNKNTNKVIYNLIINRKKFKTKEEVKSFLKNKYKNNNNYEFIITET